MKYVICKDYIDHLKSVKALKKDQNIKLKKCRKDTVTLRWFEAVMIFLSVFIGAQYCPLVYIVRGKFLPDPQRPSLVGDRYYVDEHNSIKEELVAFLSHNHSFYKL